MGILVGSQSFSYFLLHHTLTEPRQNVYLSNKITPFERSIVYPFDPFFLFRTRKSNALSARTTEVKNKIHRF
jgi:hypothetical protein